MATYESYVDSTGRTRVSGTHKNLKRSQAYLSAFGKAIARHHLEKTVPMEEGVLPAFLHFLPMSDDPWLDADLESVLDVLGIVP